MRAGFFTACRCVRQGRKGLACTGFLGIVVDPHFRLCLHERQLAQRTGGKYFRARSEEELEEIYNEIDQLEKTEIKVKEYVQYKELFPPFIYLGLALLVLEILLGQTLFRKIP